MAEAVEELRLDEVSITLLRRPLLGLTLAIAPGEIGVVTGPSGSGKSTLLSAICGTLDPAFAMTVHNVPVCSRHDQCGVSSPLFGVF